MRVRRLSGFAEGKDFSGTTQNHAIQTTNRRAVSPIPRTGILGFGNTGHMPKIAMMAPMIVRAMIPDLTGDQKASYRWFRQAGAVLCCVYSGLRSLDGTKTPRS